jgi:uncharacterized membrane protein
LAGESWTTTSYHTKGFDTFVTSKYEEGAGPFLTALRGGGIETDYLPNHLAMNSFPDSVEGLARYDVCVLSDIGANTLSLPAAVFESSQIRPSRLAAIADWVAQGGSLLMVGGYLSFQGFNAMANYRNTVLADVLPVELEPGDDREECAYGPRPTVVDPGHPIVRSLPVEWPPILGFQRLRPKAGAGVVAEVEGHPLIVIGRHGAGRTAALATDMSSHWLPAAFLEWDGYPKLFRQLIQWLGSGDSDE